MADCKYIRHQQEDKIRVTEQYSKSQKLLHFFWYLDGHNYNGDFITSM